MAGLRRFTAYRKIERPYTRRSKYKKKNFVKSFPNHKIARFDMGNRSLTESADCRLDLVSRDAIQVRHNAIESTRLIVNRKLAGIGDQNFFFKVLVYPHHGIRENKMLGGAHADRVQTGMGHPFGKVIAGAAQLSIGRKIYSVWVNKENVEKARKALESVKSKWPGRVYIDVIENKKIL